MTNANARLNSMAASDALLSGHSVCWNEPTTGPQGVNISASRFSIFRSSEMWFKFLSFIEINFDFHWVGSMLDYFRSNGSQCNFRPRNTTSVHGRQLPSTVDNFRQHLVHHNTSFIAFSMNKLKMKVGISTKVEHTKWSVAFYQEGNCSLFIWRMLQWQQDYGSVSSVWIFWSTQISPN